MLCNQCSDLRIGQGDTYYRKHNAVLQNSGQDSAVGATWTSDESRAGPRHARIRASLPAYLAKCASSSAWKELAVLTRNYSCCNAQKFPQPAALRSNK